MMNTRPDEIGIMGFQRIASLGVAPRCAGACSMRESECVCVCVKEREGVCV